MKKLIFAFVLLYLFPLISFSQNLSLDNMISLYKMDVGECNDFLSDKGWVYQGVKAGKEPGYSNITWGYGINEYTGNASAWLLLSTDGGNDNVLNYQCSKSEFDRIKKRITDIGMKKVNSGIETNGAIYTAYAGTNYVVNMRVSSNGAYKVQLASKDNFLSNFQP